MNWNAFNMKKVKWQIIQEETEIQKWGSSMDDVLAAKY